MCNLKPSQRHALHRRRNNRAEYPTFECCPAHISKVHVVVFLWKKPTKIFVGVSDGTVCFYLDQGTTIAFLMQHTYRLCFGRRFFRNLCRKSSISNQHKNEALVFEDTEVSNNTKLYKSKIRTTLSVKWIVSCTHDSYT